MVYITVSLMLVLDLEFKVKVHCLLFSNFIFLFIEIYFKLLSLYFNHLVLYIKLQQQNMIT